MYLIFFCFIFFHWNKNLRVCFHLFYRFPKKNEETSLALPSLNPRDEIPWSLFCRKKCEGKRKIFLREKNELQIFKRQSFSPCKETFLVLTMMRWLSGHRIVERDGVIFSDKSHLRIKGLSMIMWIQNEKVDANCRILGAELLFGSNFLSTSSSWYVAKGYLHTTKCPGQNGRQSAFCISD